jgi:hypothetical protein
MTWWSPCEARIRFRRVRCRSPVESHLYAEPGGAPPVDAQWEPACLVDLVQAEVAAGAAAQQVAQLSGAQRSTLATAIADFRAVLATLVPHSPLDPAGAGRPADPGTVSRVVA